jgi:hypothetical protein
VKLPVYTVITHQLSFYECTGREIKLSQDKDQASRDQKGDQQNIPLCPYCQRRFVSLDELTLHIVTRHTQSGKGRSPAQSGAK